jgi:dTDP-4-amino-4,6-dideoxygalactose transaminase
MGLCMLDEMKFVNKKRKEVFELYKRELSGVVQLQQKNENSTPNYSYFPIILKSEEQLLKVQKALNSEDIYPRRYFYPSLDTLTYINPSQFCRISRDIASRILCLPIYAELQTSDVHKICEIIKNRLC